MPRPLDATRDFPAGAELEGKTALVTGAARGFGRVVALLLASQGANVAIADLGDRRSEATYRMAGPEELDSAVTAVEAFGRRAVGISADVTSEADCQRMARETIDALGTIDILVANAGGTTQAPAWEITEQEWDFVHNLCLKGVFLTTQAVLPHMMKRRYGKIVFTSSRNGLRAERGYAHYNAAKAGVIHYGKSLALELGEWEINVNIVCPTQMTDRSPDSEHRHSDYWDQVVGRPDPTFEEFDEASGRDNLFEGLGQPDFGEVAEGVLWLVSDRSHLVTGLALPMDAGWIAKRGG
jgi:NAD(P)-dependent dehydrogenase (short-subunit alcohol dehydrogenase family)